MWWTKWHQGRGFSEYFCFPLSSFHPYFIPSSIHIMWTSTTGVHAAQIPRDSISPDIRIKKDTIKWEDDHEWWVTNDMEDNYSRLKSIISATQPRFILSMSQIQVQRIMNTSPCLVGKKLHYLYSSVITEQVGSSSNASDLYSVSISLKNLGWDTIYTDWEFHSLPQSL
jgi:hypothetical protein